MQDFEDAKDKIFMGRERKSMVMREDERRNTAYHESGHAVVAYLVGVGRKLEVLSIVKRKDALGLLAHSDTEERFTRTRTELIAAIQISFGGMTAEELFF